MACLHTIIRASEPGNTMIQTDKMSRRPGGMAEVFLMAYPTVITMFAHALMGVADTVMVGRLGTAELAAVGFTHVLYFTLLSVFMGTVEIVNTFASQSYGAGEMKESSHRCWQAIYMALMAWPVAIVISFFFEDLFRLLGPSPEVQALGTSYGTIRMYGSGPFLVYIALAFYFRGVGMVKTPMISAIVMNLVNVTLDYVLIFGKFGFPAMGVEGAAWASNIGIVVAAALLFVIFMWPNINRRFKTRSTYRPDPKLIWRMTKVGLPAGIQFFIDIAAFTVFIAFIGRMGDVALAASNIALQIENLGFNVCWGFTVATNTLVGQYIGAKKPELAIRSVGSSWRMVIIYLLTLLAVITIFPSELLGLFTEDELVINKGVMVLCLAMTFMLFDGMGMIAVGALRGAGDTRWPMVIALVAAWGFFLPFAYLVGGVMKGGVVGAWAAAAVYIVGVSSVYILRFRSGRWKDIEI